MHQVRIQPIGNDTFLVDVSCTCGRNGLKNVENGEKSFKHKIRLNGFIVKLICDCEKKYSIQPQADHFHVVED